MFGVLRGCWDKSKFSPNGAFYEHQSTYETFLSKGLQFFQLGQKVGVTNEKFLGHEVLVNDAGN